MAAALLVFANTDAAETTFTKITTGPVVTTAATSWWSAWGDFDNDGFIDLLVSTEGSPFLFYRNNRDGTFTRITSGPVVSFNGEGSGIAFADYDNDGNLDLIAGGWSAPNKLFHNNGNGTFTATTSNGLDADALAESTSWGDFDNDGYVDLFVTSDGGQPNRLYRNNGNGTFTKLTSQAVGNLLSDAGHGVSGVWGDFDKDGDLDLVVVHYANDGKNSFYRNNGNGTFTRIFQGDAGYFFGPAWGDYDNDGDLDLFIVSGGGTTPANDLLYQNNGDGSFTKITAGPMVNDHQPGGSCAWVDYDNDGYLDLFVQSGGLSALGDRTGAKNRLYHNNGDGAFTEVLTGSVVNDIANSVEGIWGDYDNDGFMDLFVGTGGHSGPHVDLLYHNDGNANSWLKLKLAGTVSNRSAIGAKVRIKATINGKTFWQMREISGGDGAHSQNDMRPNFGLGDATKAEIVRIEWPSGRVQEFRDVPAKQILEISEPVRLETGLKGSVRFKSWNGMHFKLQSSTNLIDWIERQEIVTSEGFGQYTDPETNQSESRFYRVVSP